MSSSNESPSPAEITTGAYSTTATASAVPAKSAAASACWRRGTGRIA